MAEDIGKKVGRFEKMEAGKLGSGEVGKS